MTLAYSLGHADSQADVPPSPSLVLQRLTTPDQYHIFQNADIPRADIPHPPLSKPSATEANYTRSVSHTGECRHTQDRCNPPANWPKCYPSTPGQFHMWKNAVISRAYINMRTISNADQFTHILPLAISCITTPRYYFQGTGRCTPPPCTPGGQQQYFAHFIFSCYRGKVCIGIGDKTSWTLSNLCRLLCVVIVVVVITVSCCCSSSSVIVDPQLQMNNNNKITQ